jgi:hypothetical protein
LSEIVQEEIVQEENKTFTQEEVNALIESRLARAKKQMPSKDELEVFKQWKESQKSENERLAQKEQEFQKILTERETIKRENIVLRKGVNQEDADYVMFKVSKLDGEFEDNLNLFLTENPKYTAKAGVVNTGVSAVKAQATGDEEGFLNILKKKYPNLL